MKFNIMFLYIFLLILYSQGCASKNHSSSPFSNDAKNIPKLSSSQKNSKNLSDDNICLLMRDLIDKNQINFYTVKSKISPNASRERIYEVDIDRDNVIDELIISSGSNFSHIHAKLSSAENFNIELGFVKLLKLNGELYLFETLRNIENINELMGNQLYKLNDSGIHLICNQDILTRNNL